MCRSQMGFLIVKEGKPQPSKYVLKELTQQLESWFQDECADTGQRIVSH